MPDSALLFRQATLFDGTGAAAWTGDLLVQGDRIVALAPALPAPNGAEVIQADGLSLAPGFIDIHTHADIALLSRPDHTPKIAQGVTTEVFTNCGIGFAPVTDDALPFQREYYGGLFGDASGVEWQWRSVADLLALYHERVATNVAYLVPHSALRVSAMGMADRRATGDEVRAMAAALDTALEQGAVGLSTGLYYAPMSAADVEEMTALCRVVANHDGLLAIHLRIYTDGIYTALEEILAAVRATGCRLQVSHMQLNGPRARGRHTEILRHVEATARQGVDLAYDSYPYAAGSTFLQALLPARFTEGGPDRIRERLNDPELRAAMVTALDSGGTEFDRVCLSGLQRPEHAGLEGIAIAEVAAQRGVTAGEAVCQLLLAEDLQACFIAHQQDERDVLAFLQHPLQMVGSDGLHVPGKPHPRLYGTFPRILGHFARDRGALTLEQAVHKMTAAPAARLRLPDRGVLRPGAAADLVLFDPATVADRATWTEPRRLPEGIAGVWVNGRRVWEDGSVGEADGGRHTGALPGRVLR
jgi:N-acyl-D-amino-acid deacylase